jgi:hypothetical protein
LANAQAASTPEMLLKSVLSACSFLAGTQSLSLFLPHVKIR